MEAAMRLLAVLMCVAGCLQADKAQNTACNSPVYCYGDLLDLVQRSNVFQDSKTFVDRPLKASPEDILSTFVTLQPRLANNTGLLREFVYNWTLEEGSDLLPWVPSDWKENPDFVSAIRDPELQQWAHDLNNLWKDFGRQVAPSVTESPDQHSLISVPHPFVVPGGRFREFYYWDSYWIVKGLLLCEMYQTAKDMILNFVSMIEKYGFVPNGGRVYYADRSQVPLLTQMVDLVYNTTRDMSFLEATLPSLVQEYEFWMKERIVQVEGYTLNRYAVNIDTPRPESYREDWESGRRLNESKRPFLYSNLASAAESGWDFSSRWLSNTNISSIRTKSIVPVDLNGILCQNEGTLAKLFRITGNNTEAARFDTAQSTRRSTFNSLFWNASQGLWLDWDMDHSRHLKGFYASSLVPLFWGCEENVTKHKIVLSSLNRLGVLEYPGGIPTSLQETGQQWDFPNVWAPLQWFPVLAWQQSSIQELREAAESIAQTWLRSTYAAWVAYNHTMFEKYNATEAGLPGGGGEYDLQSGFGWTNGVTLHFLSLYPNSTLSQSHTSSSLGWISVIVLLMIFIAMLIPCIFWCRWMYKSGERRYWGRVQNEHLMAASGGRGSPTTYSNKYVDHHFDVNTTGSDDDTELFTWDC